LGVSTPISGECEGAMQPHQSVPPQFSTRTGFNGGKAFSGPAPLREPELIQL